ncbi:MAG: hypothetical protein KIT45_09245 [Fimbriimonadia bacterium]|nr:hypothetical protein [Fimbriimonadia bacterium]
MWRTLVLILAAAVTLNSVNADDLKNKAEKSEGKGGNKPTKVEENRPTRSEDNKPKRSEDNPPPKRSEENKPSKQEDKRNDNRNQGNQGSQNGGDLFRKKPADNQGGMLSDPRNSGGMLSDPRNAGSQLPDPKNSGSLLSDPRNAGTLLPEARDARQRDPRYADRNRPVPITDQRLPGLVARTEDLNPWRWERFSYYQRRHESSIRLQFGSSGPIFQYIHYSYEPTPYQVVYTPYWYYDTCPPFIRRTQVVYVSRPVIYYVEVPVELPSYYYLERPRYEPRPEERLLTDLRNAWTMRDSLLIEKYVRQTGYVSIFLDGQYAYSISGQDYIDLTRDAIRNVRTQSIRLDRLTRRSDDQYVVYGTHEYIDDLTGMARRVYLMYAFQRDGDRWTLIEAGSSFQPLR